MNMRKIIAVLAAALMLFTAIPMGIMSVTAAAGDVALDANFDDSTNGFVCDGGIATSNEGGYLTLNATCADWANAYAYVDGIKADTLYKVSFKAKANKDCILQFKIANGWSGTLTENDVEVTTEWADYEFEINTAGLTEGAIVTLQSNATADNGAIYNIDDLKIVEAVNPELVGKVINGDFETGDNTGWETHQDTVIDADAAKDGSYGAHLIGGGSWGGMLNQTIVANPGKSYEITMSFKVIKTGVNIQIKDAAGSQNLAGGWYDVNSAGDWTTVTYLVTAVDAGIFINFCGSNSAPEEVYVDSISAVELIDPSYDGYITNGDFETGKTDSWDPVWWAGNLAIVEGGHNSDYALQANHGMYQLFRQAVNVKPNTNYVVWVYNKNAVNTTLLVKSCPADQNIKQAGLTGTGDEWTKTSLEFNSGDNNQVYIGIMGNVDGSSAIVDDFFMFEKPEASNDGYIVNGTFETGDLAPWNNLWGSCPKAEVIQGGMDSNWALEVVSGLWKHVRQTSIAVEANTWYKVTAWAKNAKDMSLLVKDGDDTTDIVNAGVSAGDEWTEFTAVFNSGDFTSIIFSLMGNTEESYGTFDNIVMEVTEEPCEHEYTDDCDTTCDLCDEEREAPHGFFYPCDEYCLCNTIQNPNAGHSVIHVEAKAAVSCIEYGNKEYWYCERCGTAWLDANQIRQTNMMSVRIAGECISDAEFACQDGTCINCGLPYAADAEHEYDNDYDASCNVCGDVREVEAPEIIYGDADGNGEVTIIDEALVSQYLAGWDVTLNEAAADVDGNGEVTIIDEALISQYLAGWDVTLGV